MKFSRGSPTYVYPRSLPARGVWIEMEVGESLFAHEESLPARGVWIEI